MIERERGVRRGEGEVQTTAVTTFKSFRALDCSIDRWRKIQKDAQPLPFSPSYHPSLSTPLQPSALLSGPSV